jgi:pimeloyl-ACP methyl ester carboxylesterase
MTLSNELYTNVPAEQRQLLQRFRASHPYAELEGENWRYVACGQGDSALLFLPGAFLRADMWFYQVLALEDSYRIVVPDAYALQGVLDYDQVCQAIVRSLDNEAIARATVIGISAGGGLAQYLLQAYPDRVEHAVFSHCGILQWRPELAKRVKRMLALVRLLPLFAVRRLLLRMTAGRVPAASEWVAFHNAYYCEAVSWADKQVFLRFLEAGQETSRGFAFEPKALDTWPGQILILSSRDDRGAQANLDKLQARYPRARTHVFDEGGHHTYLFFPEAYTGVLRAFLEKAYLCACVRAHLWFHQSRRKQCTGGSASWVE